MSALYEFKKMQEEFAKLLADAENRYQNYMDTLGQLENYASKLEAVLKEMELGLDSDYQGKNEFVIRL